MSSTELNSPKAKAKKPLQVVKKPPGVKPIQAKKPEPLYPLLGKKRVNFIQVARALSEDLHLTYGDEMSITKFSRILVELQGQKALQDMVYLEQSLLDKFLAYQKAKQEMIEEQNLFRSSYSTPSVGVVIPDKVSTIFDVEIRSIAGAKTPELEPFREGSSTKALLPPQ
jgi:hypothetical protein